METQKASKKANLSQKAFHWVLSLDAKRARMTAVMMVGLMVEKMAGYWDVQMVEKKADLMAFRTDGC